MVWTPAYIHLSLGIGLTDLSMNPSCLLEAKKIVRSMVYEHRQSVTQIAFDLTSSEEIYNFISVENERIDLRSQDVPLNIMEVFTKERDV
jgi:phosphoenolpyruvate-protein kinase (PTS system EI component)